MCAPLAQEAVKPGEQIIINLLDGRKLSGTLADFDLMNGRIELDTLADATRHRITLDEAKSVYLPQLRTWIPGRLSADSSSPPPRLHDIKQEFRVDFIDGDVLEGETIGFSSVHAGLFLFPLQTGTQFIYTFLPKEAIKGYNIGPKLGEVLIKDHHLMPDEMDSALSAQNKEREQPLGEFLRTKAIVTALELERALERQKQMPNMRLGEVLVSENLISEEQLTNALEAQKNNRKKPLGKMLVDRGLVSTEQIQQALGKKLGIPFVDLTRFQLDPEAITKVSLETIRKFNLLPLHLFGGKIVVAVENPLDSEPLDAVRFQTNLVVEPVIARIEQIKEALDTYVTGTATPSLSMADLEADIGAAAGVVEEDDVLGGDANAASDNVVVKLVNMLVIDAYQKDASDIHIEPYSNEGKTIVRIRKDGSLLKFYEVPAKLRFALVSRIKIMAGLDISERRKPQDGKIDFKRFGPLRIELRVATIPTTGGQEDVVMRILASGEPIPLEKLSLSADNHTRLKGLVAKPYGLFFVCGPTGSGKTTTLHSILGHLNTPERKIWTAEDPVEITQKGLRQVQVNPKVGLTFAAAMRAFLRADPDIIMVGEMRDEETTSTGIEASLTGHLVFATLHTNSAPESIVRLLDMGMDPFNFSDALLGVLAQRLAKRLCPNCSESYQPDDAELNELLLEYCYELEAAGAVQEASERDQIRNEVLSRWKAQFADSNGQFTLKRAKGCDQCDNTGYRGRVGVHELLSASEEVKHLILERAPVVKITRTAINEGMRTLKQDGIEKVLQGITDINQVRTVCIK